MVSSLPYIETQHVSYIFRISALLAIMQRFWLGIEIVQHLSSLVTEWSWAWDLFCNDGICSLTYRNIMHQTIKCWEMLGWDFRYWREHFMPQFTNPIHNRVNRTIIPRYQDKYSIFQIAEWVFSANEKSRSLHSQIVGCSNDENRQGCEISSLSVHMTSIHCPNSGFY